jgi:CCR4-NOT transcription complex subunit 2
MMTNIGLRLDLQLPKLYVNFTSPWTDPSLELLNPELYLPRSYNTAEMNLPPPQQKMGSFSDMTLFYIFYTMPRDILQEAAAQELHNRSWRYHKDMKVWLVKDPQSADTIQKTANAERGRYVIFDPTLWKRLSQDMVIAYEALEERPSMINNAPTPSGFAAMPISQPSHLVHMSANAPQAYQQHPLLAHFLNAGNSTNGA